MLGLHPVGRVPMGESYSLSVLGSSLACDLALGPSWWDSCGPYFPECLFEPSAGQDPTRASVSGVHTVVPLGPLGVSSPWWDPKTALCFLFLLTVLGGESLCVSLTQKPLNRAHWGSGVSPLLWIILGLCSGLGPETVCAAGLGRGDSDPRIRPTALSLPVSARLNSPK